MSIATLFSYLRGNAVYESLDWPGKVSFIYKNPVVRISSKVEAERWARCMRFDPSVLENANHCWALELSLADPHGIQDSIYRARVAWIAAKLQNYNRTLTMKHIEDLLPQILKEPQTYANMTIRDSIITLERKMQDISRQRSEEHARIAEERRRQEVVEQYSVLYDIAKSCQDTFEAARLENFLSGRSHTTAFMTPLNLYLRKIIIMDSYAEQRERLINSGQYPRALHRIEYVWTTLSNIHRPIVSMGDPRINFQAALAWQRCIQMLADGLWRMRVEQKAAEEAQAQRRRDAEAAHRLEEQRRNEAEEAIQDHMRKQREMRRMLAYAEQNKTVRITITDSNGSEEYRFLDKSQLGMFEALFQTPLSDEDSEEPCCQICMSAKGTLSCGNERCTTMYCPKCFHTWFSGAIAKDKCCSCRRDYIPLATRTPNQ